MDCDTARFVLQQFVAGEAVTQDDLDQALDHVSTHDACRGQFDFEASAACEEVQDELPDAARSVRNGEALADRHPALAAHVEGCDRCQAILAELVREDEEREEEMPEHRVEPRELFDRALYAALSDNDAIVRLRAAERLAYADALSSSTQTTLITLAAEDPDDVVRAAARAALERHGVEPPEPAVPGKGPLTEKERLLGQIPLPEPESGKEPESGEEREPG